MGTPKVGKKKCYIGGGGKGPQKEGGYHQPWDSRKGSTERIAPKKARGMLMAHKRKEGLERIKEIRNLGPLVQLRGGSCDEISQLEGWGCAKREKEKRGWGDFQPSYQV